MSGKQVDRLFMQFSSAIQHDLYFKQTVIGCTLLASPDFTPDLLTYKY